MLVLVACEESQVVTIALRKLGHTAFSCDVQECSGGHPEWHIQHDVREILNGNTTIHMQDGAEFGIHKKWDMIIAFPPCTHLAISGARHFAKKRADGRQQQGIDFFMAMANADCDKIAIENPVGIMSTIYRKPDQIVQPYEFGDPYRKKTCLWLKNLPKLQPTNIVEPCDIRTYVKRDGTTTTFSDWFNKGGKERQKLRSKTFKGIAEAMATQWAGGEIDESL
jgi:hypothetical protein